MITKGKKPMTSKRTPVMKRDLFRGRYPSLWNFWRDGVTPSLVDLFHDCPEQTRQKYVEGWNSRTTSMPMEFGSCCHFITETVTDSPTDAKVDKAIKLYAEQWSQRVPMATTFQLSDQELVYDVAVPTMKSYFKRWDGDYRKDAFYSFGKPTPFPVEWVEREKQFAVPFRFTDGETTWLRGRRDSVFRDKDGRLWVKDLKCRGDINEEEILETMPWDFQIMSYIWSVWQEYKEMPRGGIIDSVRRCALRQKKTETPRDFRDRIALDLSDSARWDYLDEKSSRTGYFVRFAVALTEKEIKQWVETDLRPVMEEMRMWWEGTIPHVPRRKHLIRYHNRCELFYPVINGDYSNCYRRDRVFPELDYEVN